MSQCILESFIACKLLIIFIVINQVQSQDAPGKCKHWSNVTELELPKINVTVGENSRSPSTELWNETRGFENCRVQVEFLCHASYPIEWVEIYEKDIDILTDIKHRITKYIWSERVLQENQTKTGNIIHHLPRSPLSNFNSTVTTYTGNLGLNYPINSSLCVAANFSCRSVKNPCLQSNVFAVVDKDKETIQYFKRSNELLYDKLQNSREQDKCDVVISVVMKDHRKLGWKCDVLKRNQYVNVTTNVTRCDAAMHCNSYFRHNRKRKCVKRLPANAQCPGCMYVNVSTYLHPGIVWCGYDNGKLITAFQYFFAVHQTSHLKPDVLFPELYLDWSEADPNKLLYLEPIRGELYVGQHVTIFCRISRHYFAYGHRFIFEFKNGSIYFSEAIDGQHDHRDNTNLMNITVSLDDVDLTKVYCIAPVWNTTEWVNQSQSIHLRNDATTPSIDIILPNDESLINAKGEHEVTIALHERNKTIKCIGHGKPAPEIFWTPMDIEKEMIGVEVNEEEFLKALVFRYASYANEGRYKCEAKNFLGSAKMLVSVNIQDKMSIFAHLSAIVIFALVIVFGVTLSICWRKIQRQRKQLRVLTEEEVREFREGNSNVVQQSAFLDNAEAIQALPYNDQYEIPLRQLFVDTSALLGTGNFGQVFKGLVLDRYGNGSMIEVAVKTGKPKFAVKYFKALLSEVKIMAHIGKHSNVVSLIGACTQNIRQREIFIAVEFCEKGSLEQFLKSSRVSFVNLISNDTIYITSNFGGDGSRKYQNLQNEQAITPLLDLDDDIASSSISTVHLLKWSREIANGMEFLGSKKIIHADLAARNVLLTQDRVAKIGDFGLSRKLMEYSDYVRCSGSDCELPWKWMALELLEEGKFSPQSDAWSFGVTLWEIFSLGQTPYPCILWNSNFIAHLKEGLRLHKPSYATSHIYNLMLDCWAVEPSHRPTFTELKDVFEGLLMYSSSNEYFKTECSKQRNSNLYVNRSTNCPISNPSYSLIDHRLSTSIESCKQPNLTLSSESKETELATFEKARSSARPMEEAHGYLRPLMSSYFGEQQI